MAKVVREGEMLANGLEMRESFEESFADLVPDITTPIWLG
jgi:hypothetical protein